ncbi:MAG: hypothetical protein GY920_12750 [Aliivibrio sp.]|nr:hypothetical protein [Aliivibrio sp.]
MSPERTKGQVFPGLLILKFYKMQTKIELKSGFSTGYLPEGVTYKNYTMLVAIANYSENGSCVSTATGLLDEDNDLAKKRGLLAMTGGFMSAVARGDFATAWNRADYKNRKALLKGLENLEIEL